MFTVYALCSIAFDKIYIGYTADLENRLISHNELGTNGYTLKYRPWTLIHTEGFGTKTDALIREKQLKSSKGRDFIRQIVKDQYRHSDD